LSKQEIVFIINPIAGNRNPNISQIISKTFIDSVYKPTIVYSEYKNHGFLLTKAFLKEGISHFVAVGGDGTVNEIASALIQTDAILSILPIGSGNGLARALGISLNPEIAIKNIFQKKIKEIDCGMLNDFPFFCTSGIGFDALCAIEFEKTPQKRGFWKYVKTIFLNYPKYHFTEIYFNQQYGKVFSITFSNSNQFGNNAYISPDADLSDGYLDCTVINPHPKYLGIYLAYLLMSKKIRNAKCVEYYRGKKFEVFSSVPIAVHLDGEIKMINDGKIKINVIKNALKITI
jgi:diacylglycerol kinase (ATP)